MPNILSPMRSGVAGVLGSYLLLACVELPAESAGAATGELDAGLGFAWLLDAGPRRPATAPPYAGPECGTVALLGADAAFPVVASGAGSADGGSGPSSGAAPGADPDTVARPRAPGEIVISELMPDPVVVDDSAGEWIELHNPGADALSLEGCAIDDGGRSARTIASALRVPPGGHVTIARSEQAGFVPDYVMSLSLGNGADSVALLCDGVEIDRVRYGDALAAPSGASLSRAPDGTWCASLVSYGDNLGTPGAPNPPCPARADEDAGAP